jgi:SHS2 domain-containing protein
LLAELLGELVFRAETEGFLCAGLEELELDGGSLRATATGHWGTPSALVKAVTYHRLRFERAGDRYRAGVVLDV